MLRWLIQQPNVLALSRTEKAERLPQNADVFDFALTSDRGETVRLSDLRGKQVVLYFYPKDDTPATI